MFPQNYSELLLNSVVIPLISVELSFVHTSFSDRNLFSRLFEFGKNMFLNKSQLNKLLLFACRY